MKYSIYVMKCCIEVNIFNLFSAIIGGTVNDLLAAQSTATASGRSLHFSGKLCFGQKHDELILLNWEDLIRQKYFIEKD